MMAYLVTWIEGDEVFYRIVREDQLADIWETEKNFIISDLGLLDLPA